MAHPLNPAPRSRTELRRLPPPSLADKLRRLVWNVAALMLFRTSPTPLHGFRRALLRLFGARIGRNAAIYPGCQVWAPWHLTVHENAVVGGGVQLFNVAPIEIGAKAIVSQGAFLCSATRDYDSPDFDLLSGAITLEPNCWIAAEAFIGPGVTVAEGAVVGARAVVTRSVAARARVAGNPAREIGRRKAGIANGLRRTDQT